MFDPPNASPISGPLLDGEQAAAMIRVHPKTLQRYARNGIVIGLRIGKLWRFRVSDLLGRPPECDEEILDQDEDTLDEETNSQYAGSSHSCSQPRV